MIIADGALAVAVPVVLTKRSALVRLCSAGMCCIADGTLAGAIVVGVAEYPTPVFNGAIVLGLYFEPELARTQQFSNPPTRLCRRADVLDIDLPGQIGPLANRTSDRHQSSFRPIQ